MANDYLKKYWWLILVVVPVLVAIIQILPSFAPKPNNNKDVPSDTIGNDGAKSVTKNIDDKSLPSIGGDSKTTTKPKLNIEEIEINPNTITIQVGESKRLYATVRNTYGEIQKGEAIEWESSNLSVVTTTKTGKVTGIREGSAIVMAKSKGVIGTAEIKIMPISVYEVKILPEKFSIFVGSTVPLTAELRDKKGNVLKRPVKWSSNNSNM